MGFLFLAPVSAASLLVAILQHGHSSITENVLDLLYAPLLISFDDKLHQYLEEVVKQNSESDVARISEVLTRKQHALDEFASIETLVELHPSERHRQIERVRLFRQMTQAMKEGMKQSVFSDLVAKQNLLYGTTSTLYIDQPGRVKRKINFDMKLHSIEYEYPKLDIFDPEGLKMMLQVLMYERRTNL